MSYRNDIIGLRTRVQRIEAELIPVHVGVDSATALALVARAQGLLRAADRMLAAALAERLDPTPALPAPHALAVAVEVYGQSAAREAFGR